MNQDKSRESGKVAAFRRSWGFITPDNASDGDVFAHFRNVEGEGYRRLTRGEPVTFVRGLDSQGRECAMAIRQEVA